MPLHTSLRRDEATARAQLLTVERVEVELDLSGADDPSCPLFTSRTRLALACARPGAGTFLDLRAEELVSVRLDGEPVHEPDWRDGRLHLPCLPARCTLEVEARMAYSDDGEGLHRHVDVDGTCHLYAMSFLDAAPRWFCCADQPDLKAPVVLRVQAPDGWLVRGNTPAHRRGHGWELDATPPLPSYLVGLVAGPYVEHRAEHRGRPLALLARRGLAAELERDAEELLRLTAGCLDAFEDLFGMELPFPCYQQVFVPDFNAGAMEVPGCVLLREQYLHRGESTATQRAARAGTIAHEMAHHWFGDLVTMRWWDELWLNESFAEYLGHRVAAQVTGHDLWLDFGCQRKPWGLRADAAPSTHPVAGNGAVDSHAALANFDGISYAKGAAVLRQLAAWMGEEAFFGGLREHFRRHAYGTATMDDLLRAWREQQVEGLDEWCGRWLGTTGADRLRVVLDEDRVVLRREPGDPAGQGRPHALAVSVLDAGAGEVGRAELVLDQDRLDTGLRLGRGGFALADSGDLCWATTRPAGRDVAWTRLPVSRIAAPASRVAAWSAVRDAVREAELAPAQAWAMVLRELPSEQHTTILTMLVELAGGLAADWCAPSARPQRRAALARVLDAALATATGDRQLVLWRALAGVSDDAARLRTWLCDGLPGLDGSGGRAAGPEDRWRLLTRLAVLGQDVDALVAEELRRDRSSAAALAAARTRAAAPTPAAKQQALGMLLDPTVPASLAGAASEGLFPADQAGDPALDEMVERWFEAVRELPRHRQGWALAKLVRAGFPHGHPTRRVLGLAEGLLNTPDSRHVLDQAVRRELVDATDALRRQVAALELDRPGGAVT